MSTGNGSGLPPIWTVKTGNSYGINVGLVTNFDEGANHYGINIPMANFFDGGNVYGLSLGVASGSPDSVNKDALGKRNPRVSEVNGLEFSVMNIDAAGFRKMNGVQAGLYNSNAGGHNVQIGVYNSSGVQGGKISKGSGLNYNFGE